MNQPSGGGMAGRKRFYKEVTVAEGGNAGAPAFRILLDGRSVRTPARRELAVPSRSLAEAVADEWRRQETTIVPGSMPLTRLLNSAIDGVADRAPEVRAAILEYASSDLLCYFAASPQELIERQSRRWGAIHAWIKQAFGVELSLAFGVMPVVQDERMLAQLDAAFGSPTPLELAALHVITATTGAALLSLAVLHGHVSPAEAWDLAHIDEDFQIEKWGSDAEAQARRAHRWSEIEAACLVLDCLRSAPAS